MSLKAHGSGLAEARANIALVKYWGKRDATLNLPAAGSLSLTLDGLTTRTRVDFMDGLPQDELVLNGEPAPEKARRKVSQLLDLVRAEASRRHGDALPHAKVTSTNSFPTGAGLASSASGFAALALAASDAADLALSPGELSVLARRGSGSAARSIFGGLVEMRAGERSDGADAHAVPLDPLERWPLRMVVAVISDAAKTTSSTDGMDHTSRTSPYFPAWVAEVPRDLDRARDSIARRDLQLLGEVTEESCLKMHASALAARPGVVYLRGPTLEALHTVRALRSRGLGAWFTADAGPQAKALCLADDASAIAQALGQLPGVVRTLICAPGAGAVSLPVEPQG